MDDITFFSQLLAKLLKLRSTSKPWPAEVANSVRQQLGLSLVVMFPRQSGKNELQAQIEAYLLMLFTGQGRRDRQGLAHLEAADAERHAPPGAGAEAQRLTAACGSKESGYIYRLGRARIAFFSGTPEANIVGATASTLLEVDEAQDVQLEKFDKEIAPMAASPTPRASSGARPGQPDPAGPRAAAAARPSGRTGGGGVCARCRRVAAEVPAYGCFVAEQVRRAGAAATRQCARQYFSERSTPRAGCSRAARRALMEGEHPRSGAPQPREGLLPCCWMWPGRTRAWLAGPRRGAAGEPGRDATALTMWRWTPPRWPTR